MSATANGTGGTGKRARRKTTKQPETPPASLTDADAENAAALAESERLGRQVAVMRAERLLTEAQAEAQPPAPSDDIEMDAWTREFGPDLESAGESTGGNGKAADTVLEAADSSVEINITSPSGFYPWRQPNKPIAEGGDLVSDAIPNSPIGAAEHIVPVGYSIQHEQPRAQALHRVFHASEGPMRVPIAANPVLIKSWVSNVTTGNKMLELTWQAVSKWRTLIADRALLLDAQKIVGAVGNTGFPVNSTNKKRMVDYLVAYLDCNVRRIEIVRISEQMGWQARDGGFLAGSEQIETAVRFHPVDVGDQQLAAAVRTSGTFAGWCEAVGLVTGYPRVMLGVYASLAVPLLRVLDAPSFAVDWSYETSSGKTTTLHVAASVWGCPDERAGSSYISGWDATPIWFERAAASRCDLPVILDDTKRAQKIRGESVVPKVLYDLTGGAGRGRGSVKGSQVSRHWRTIVLSTGEATITDLSRDGGTAARVLCLWGPPFGGQSAAVGDLIAEVDSRLRLHYGWAGPAFVRGILGLRGEWEAWRAQWRTLSRELGSVVARSCGAGVASRVSDYLAVIELAARVAHRVLDLPWAFASPVLPCVDAIASRSADVDRASEALEVAVSWAVAQRERFWDSSRSSGAEMPPGGWLGRWDLGAKADLTRRDWEWLGFMREPLLRELARSGYDARACIALWRDRGWLETNTDRPGRSDLVVKFADKSLVRIVAVRRSAVETITGQGNDARG